MQNEIHHRLTHTYTHKIINITPFIKEMLI